MATIALTAQAPFKAAGHVFTLVQSVVASFDAWNSKRMDHRILSQLSDAQLNDIGMTRGDF
jgi:uncharacterized protein YjiS (DUF1127 family)